MTTPSTRIRPRLVVPDEGGDPLVPTGMITPRELAPTPEVPVAGAQAAAPDFDYGPRYGTDTPKGLGYFGPLMRPDGNGMMGEYSVGLTINGHDIEVPSMVPTLTHDEVQQILAMGEGDRMPPAILEKARQHALQRLAAGLDPFASPSEMQQGLYPDLPRTSIPSVYQPGALHARQIVPSFGILPKQP